MDPYFTHKRLLHLELLFLPSQEVTVSLIFQSKSQHTEEATFSRPQNMPSLGPWMTVSPRPLAEQLGGHVCRKMKG